MLRPYFNGPPDTYDKIALTSTARDGIYHVLFILDLPTFVTSNRNDEDTKRKVHLTLQQAIETVEKLL